MAARLSIFPVLLLSGSAMSAPLQIDAPGYTLGLDPTSGVALSLAPKSVTNGFDFLPIDRLTKRTGDGFVQLGDVTFRAREVGAAAWVEGATAARRRPVTPLPSQGDTLAAYDLTPTLPTGAPLRIVRRWVRRDGRLALLFEVSNPGARPVEIGAFGMAMPFNNVITDRSLEEAHARCSFTDPYIGADAGYLRVTRLSGTGPTMVVVPVGRTPLEAWRLLDEPMRPNQTFEGMMEWTVHTRAYAEREWRGVEPWNVPTGAALAPGATRVYGVAFLPSPSIRAIESRLTAAGRPVAVGLPGYVVPMDAEARLFLRSRQSVRKIEVAPAGALTWIPNREGRHGWRGYTLRGRAWGRARLSVTYADGTLQTVNYNVIAPAREAVASLGRFLTTKAWFDDKADPFGRAPSPLSYDRQADRPVTQDPRAWIAGLGDEGGSGNWLALAMKAQGQPVAGEVAKLEAFVDGVLWGNLQFKSGPNRYGVRKSVFFYDPKLLPTYPYDPKIDWRSWTSWNRATTDDVGRGYNYPHVVAAYWALYRIARNHPALTKAHDWRWYLEQATATTEFLTSRDAKGEDRVGYWRLGLMEGDIFVALLDDLRREGWTDRADALEARMRERADRWRGEAYPFGSEMAWDSTGQEEVYAWCRRFGYDDKAEVTLNSILAYDPTVPHWGYDGNARRYWDFLYGGKLPRIERQIHHYGSGLNAIPLLTEYRAHPDDLYLLRVGYAGTMGALTNIDREGFASAAFHSFPSTLAWDAYSGDYGPNFFGHAWNAGAYLVDTPDFGWQAFGGTISRGGGKIALTPTDAFRRRVFLAPVGLFLTLDAGEFRSVTYDPRSRSVEIALAPGDAATPAARLRIETSTGQGAYAPALPLSTDAGAYRIPLGPSEVRLALQPVRTPAPGRDGAK